MRSISDKYTEKPSTYCVLFENLNGQRMELTRFRYRMFSNHLCSPITSTIPGRNILHVTHGLLLLEVSLWGTSQWKRSALATRPSKVRLRGITNMNKELCHQRHVAKETTEGDKRETPIDVYLPVFETYRPLLTSMNQ